MSNLQRQIDDLLTWAKVRQWAEEQPEQCFVGKSWMSSACPLACYLHEQPEIRAEIYVGFAVVKCMDRQEARLPVWATLCIKQVDQEGDRDVLREQFLQILDACKPEEASHAE